MTQRNAIKGIAGALICVVVLLGMQPVSARTVVQCKEPDGTVSFRDRCTPEQAKTGEKKIRAAVPQSKPSVDELAKKNPVVLYAVPNCDTCDLVRLQLQSRKIPFGEKNVSSDSDNQAALEKISGALTVPTVTIGSKVQTGYDRAALNQQLTDAGYPPPAEEKATAPAAPATK